MLNVKSFVVWGGGGGRFQNSLKRYLKNKKAWSLAVVFTLPPSLPPCFVCEHQWTTQQNYRPYWNDSMKWWDSKTWGELHLNTRGSCCQRLKHICDPLPPSSSSTLTSVMRDASSLPSYLYNRSLWGGSEPPQPPFILTSSPPTPPPSLPSAAGEKREQFQKRERPENTSHHLKTQTYSSGWNSSLLFCLFTSVALKHWDLRNHDNPDV